MSSLAGFDPSIASGRISSPVSIPSATNSIINPTKNAQNFLSGFASRLLAPGISAIKNKDLIQQAIQGNPSALSQAVINVGGTAAGLPGAALIGTDQILKKTTGKGIVQGIEDLYRQTKGPNYMPGMGRQGFGGFF